MSKKSFLVTSVGLFSALGASDRQLGSMPQVLWGKTTQAYEQAVDRVADVCIRYGGQLYGKEAIFWSARGYAATPESLARLNAHAVVGISGGLIGALGLWGAWKAGKKIFATGPGPSLPEAMMGIGYFEPIQNGGGKCIGESQDPSDDACYKQAFKSWGKKLHTDQIRQDYVFVHFLEGKNFTTTIGDQISPETAKKEATRYYAMIIAWDYIQMIESDQTYRQSLGEFKKRWGLRENLLRRALDVVPFAPYWVGSYLNESYDLELGKLIEQNEKAKNFAQHQKKLIRAYFDERKEFNQPTRPYYYIPGNVLSVEGDKVIQKPYKRLGNGHLVTDK